MAKRERKVAEIEETAPEIPAAEVAEKPPEVLPKRLRYLMATYGKSESERKFQQEQEEKKILFP